MSKEPEPSLYDRINRGDYKNDAPYPSRPERPPAMQKKARDLTDQEIATLAEVSAKFAAAEIAYREGRERYRQRDGEMDAKFWADVYEDCGVTEDDPFVQKMRSMAWEQGHSNGHSEVYSHFTDLMELYQLYADARLCGQKTLARKRGKRK